MMHYNFSNKLLKNQLIEIFRIHNVTGINFDSRLIQPGNAFFAISGYNQDGNEFIDKAIAKGACIVFSDKLNSNSQNKNNIIIVDNVRSILAIAAEIFYPKLPKNLISVTGTNGKTSVTNYCEQLFAHLSKRSASISSIGIKTTPSKLVDTVLPYLHASYDIITLRKFLDLCKSENIDYVSIEASSHGIHQKRLANIKFKAIGFSSFSNDHLDYHKDLKNYLDAKLELFKNNLKQTGIAVINSEIAQIDEIISFFNKHLINYIKVGKNGDINIEIIEQSINHQRIRFIYQNQIYEFTTNIIGSFQSNNLVIAAMLVLNCGFCMTKIVPHLSKLTAVDGRLQRVGDINGNYHIFIDFAHTPDSLQKSLQELRLLKADGRLKVVFGCGGDRDQTKRFIMGKIAGDLADEIIVTDDNPRFENPQIIRKAIIEGIEKNNYIEIADRFEAIKYAVSSLKKGDILIIAGKGCEKYQIIRNQNIPFNDFIVTESIIKQMKKL